MQVVVVLAHPNSDSFSHALAERACAGLRDAGHEVHLLDLYALGFRAAMSSEEHLAYHGDHPALDPMVADHGALVGSAQALVFVYPTWWSSMPAILKGWLERVMVPGVAFVFNDAGKVRPGLSNVRRVVGISVYGSPRAYVKLVNDNGRRTITRALRLNTGVRTRSTWLGLYAIDTATAEQRAGFLDRVEQKMRSL
ncbi:MAG: NAD(P)H-dependent oxidoreductase [Ilumatobacteraceae bacterium]